MEGWKQKKEKSETQQAQNKIQEETNENEKP